MVCQLLMIFLFLNLATFLEATFASLFGFILCCFSLYNFLTLEVLSFFPCQLQ